jgi:hypothetical protein
LNRTSDDDDDDDDDDAELFLALPGEAPPHTAPSPPSDAGAPVPSVAPAFRSSSI